MPERPCSKKYEAFNTLFIIFMVILVVFSVFKISYAAIPLIIMTYLVIFKKTKHYQWFTFTGGVMIIGMITLGVLGELKTGKDFLIAGGIFILSLIFIFFGILVPKGLAPGPGINRNNQTQNNN